LPWQEKQHEKKMRLTFMTPDYLRRIQGVCKDLQQIRDDLKGDGDLPSARIAEVLAVSEETSSFTGALLEVAIETLPKKEGSEVRFSLQAKIKPSTTVGDNAAAPCLDKTIPRSLRVAALVTQPRGSGLDLNTFAGVDRNRVQSCLQQIATVNWQLERRKLVHMGSRLRHFDVSSETESVTLYALHKLTRSATGPIWERYTTSVMPPELAQRYLMCRPESAQTMSGPVYHDSHDDDTASRRSVEVAIYGFGTFVYQLSNRGGRHIFATGANSEFSFHDLEVVAILACGQTL
jgi:hypothetical protein